MPTPFLKTFGLGAILASSLFFGAVAAQAANGFTVSVTQETNVKVGMTRGEVQTLLGRPAHNLKYRAEPGRTWTYGVLGTTGQAAGGSKVFDIDFSADGKVVSSGERLEEMD